MAGTRPGRGGIQMMKLTAVAEASFEGRREERNKKYLDFVDSNLKRLGGGG